MEYVLGVIYFVIFFCMLVGIAGCIFIKDDKDTSTIYGGLAVVMVIAFLAVQLARWMI